jgi:hypothetical protein
MITLDFKPLPPYQTYFVHNPNSLSDLWIIGVYGVMPTTSITVSVSFSFPGYDNGVFNDTASFNPKPSVTTFARRISNDVIN